MQYFYVRINKAVQIIIKLILVLALLAFSMHVAIIVAQANREPIVQLNKFGLNLQTLNTETAFKSLLESNPIYPDGTDYAQQLIQHYEYLVSTHGGISNFTLTQTRKLADHLFYYQYYSEHGETGIIWEFEFGLRGEEWYLTKIYFKAIQ